LQETTAINFVNEISQIVGGNSVFLESPNKKIRRTFQATTQNAVNVLAGHNIGQTHNSPYPALNVKRRNEPVASDTIFAVAPAIGTGGQRMAQIFVGRKSLVIDVYGMSSTKEFVNTLEDVIRKRGAMDLLVTDSANVEISRRVVDILRALCIDSWQSEPHYQWQNFAEHRWKLLQRNHHWVMNRRDVPNEAWLLCLEWVADVMNMTAERSLNWRPPLEVLTGATIDISLMLIFMFWDVVYVKRYPDHTHHHVQYRWSRLEVHRTGYWNCGWYETWSLEIQGIHQNWWGHMYQD
jgi:hypothetical protein